MLPSTSEVPLVFPKTLPQQASPTILQSNSNSFQDTQTVKTGKSYWFSLNGQGSNAGNGNISSLYGYDQYSIYSSTFNDDILTFTFANNYVEQQFLSDGSNYSRITNQTDGLLLEAYALTTSPVTFTERNVTLMTFNPLTGVNLKAGIDVATSSFLISTTNGLIAPTGTISSLNLTVLDLDGQLLTANPSELLLNGVPVTTASNVSSLSEWSYDPAISSINADGNDLLAVRAGYFSSIQANGIVTNSLTAISTIQNFDYISTQQLQTDKVSCLSLDVSSINGLSINQLQSTTQDLVVSSLTAASFVSTAAVQASTFNGYTVSDFLSTSASQYDPNPLFSTLVSQFFVSTLDLEVSSINGHEINQNSVIISTVNTSALNAIQISSIVGDVSLQLVSTLSFSASLGSNSFNLGGIDLGLGNIFGQITGGALGIMSLVTSGVALGTGVAALHQTRGTNNINTTNYELVNGTTQLQISTIPDFVSSILRFNSGDPADQVIGQEVFVSTLYPPGTFIRSMSDPLNTVSTPGSTIQAFGQWTPLSFQQTSFISSLEVNELVLNPVAGLIRGDPVTSKIEGINNISTQTANIDYINGYTGNTVAFGDAANGNNIFFDTTLASGGLQIDTFPPGNSFMNADKIAIDFIEAKNVTDITVNANVNRLVASNTNFLVSTVQIGPSTILSAENDVPALVVRNATDARVCQVNASAYVIGDIDEQFIGAYGYNSSFDRAIVLNSSIQTKFVAYLDDLTNLQNNSLSTFLVQTSSIQIGGLANSTITIGTAATAGSVGQPAGRLLVTGQDMDLGQNDLYAQQVRLGFGNPGGSAQPELIFYPPDGTNPKQLNVAGSDATLRITSTINSGAGGYLLDTFLNPPLFSTINNSLALVARFPSTTTNTIGFSTMTVSQNYLFSAYSSTNQLVVAANTATNLTHNTVTTNVGGFTNLGSTITVPVAGIYEIGTSIQFITSSGGTNAAFFWLKKNGSNVPQTNSKVSIVNNGDTIGTVTFFDSAVANDQYTIAIESSDTNMGAGFIAATGDMPAVPSVITNIKRIG